MGTSGWSYPHWRGVFYPAELPAARWFAYYCRQFDTVEINSTFYRLPRVATFQGWRRQAPAGFLYAVKAHRLLTHRKRLRRCGQPLRAFLQRTAVLRGHLGPVLYQLPPNFRRDVDRLEAFCARLPRRMTHVFEFRDPDWLTEDTFAILRRYRVCLCWHDLLPHHPLVVTGGAIYVRFHGVGERYGGCYSDQALRGWARRLCAAAGPRRTVYAYFNNDAQAYAVANAKRLRALLALYAGQQAARRGPSA